MPRSSERGMVASAHPSIRLYWKYRIETGDIMKNKHAVSALAALAQESRLAAFRLLVQAGPQGLAASRIAEALGMPPSSLSFHLKELSNANLIVPRQEGRFVIYAAQFDTMNALLGFLTENCCGGAPCSSNGTSACEPGASTPSNRNPT
jgi:DNA-binding transcriptional ArsR family regulator